MLISGEELSEEPEEPYYRGWQTSPAKNKKKKPVKAEKPEQFHGIQVEEAFRSCFTVRIRPIT